VLSATVSTASLVLYSLANCQLFVRISENISCRWRLTFSHTYATSGTYTVEFAAWNCNQTALIPDTVEVIVIDMAQGGYTIYLPIVLRGG